MKRRQALQSLAGISAASALSLPVPAQQPASSAINEKPKLETSIADAAAQPICRFFSADQFAALQRLSEILMPAVGETPGAKQAGAADFLDFLISDSPADRQMLYRDGLDELNAEARSRYGHSFAEVSPVEVKPLLASLREPWTYRGPANPSARFLHAAKLDVLYATTNSREWSLDQARRSRRAGGIGTYWYPID